jgi:hypothetical protein
VKRLNLGGKALTNLLKETVSYRSLDMRDEGLLMEQLKEQLCWTSQVGVSGLGVAEESMVCVMGSLQKQLAVHAGRFGFATHAALHMRTCAASALRNFIFLQDMAWTCALESWLSKGHGACPGMPLQHCVDTICVTCIMCSCRTWL